MNTEKASPAEKHCAWYLLYTKPREERRALENLQNQHYSCFLPTVVGKRIVKGKLVEVEEPLFSRYLFIRLDAVAGSWSPIRNTRGVNSLVTFGGKFACVPDSLVETLQRSPRRLEEPFAPGDRVEIRNGPFAGIEGIFQSNDGEVRAILLIELMSKSQTLHLPIEMLKKI